MSLPPLALVVAHNAQRVIGVDGDLPWRIREDLRHFRRVTMGHAMIMGRRTYDSIGRPLPGRRSIVLTRDRQLQIPGCDVVHSLEEAISEARAGGDEEPRIIGGAQVYAAALPFTTRIFLTEVDRPVDGDTFFPALDPKAWRESARRPGRTPGVVFVELLRRQGAED